MDMCKQCFTHLVKCPDCDIWFCPDCGRTENDLEEDEEE